MKRLRYSSWTMQLITSTISTTMVLVLLGVVILTMLTARVIGDSVKENLTVTVILEDETPKATAEKLQHSLEEKRYIGSIQYISPEQALNEQIESMGLDPTDFLGENPFSISMELKMNPDYACNDSLNWITSELKGMAPITNVIYQKDLVEGLNKNLTRISLLLLGIALLLVVVSLVLIHNTVKLSVFNHRFRIHTMKLVGARWSLIRRPFILRAIGIGLTSAVLAGGILLGCLMWAEKYDGAATKFITMQNLGITALGLLLVGLTITVLCTYISVTNSLKKRESDLH